MAFTLIPRNDHALATRVKRQLMGFMSYMMFAIPLGYAVENDWMRVGYAGLGWFTVAALVINITFLVAIRAGYTRRFQDPSVMVWQVAVAGMLALVIAYFSNQATVIALALFFSSFFFGVFSFSLRQYLALTAVATVGYGLMLLLKYEVALNGSTAYRLELLDYMILVIVLLWMSLLGSYIAALRGSLASKKDALAAALARLKELASRDELTGLYNRRHLMEALAQQQERTLRHQEPFSLCIIDIDKFKHINDTHGHGVGDEALRGFADRIRAQLRCMDVIGRDDSDGAPGDSTFGRYGGEEFLLLLPYAEAAGALACIQRLRDAVDGQPFQTSAGALSITFSAGVAHHLDGESITGLLSRADEALYLAKSGGRNRIQVAG